MDTNETSNGSFTIKLSEQDIAFFDQIRNAREAEAKDWLAVRSALREYISRWVDTTENAHEVEDLHSMFLPDLVDEIVEELRGE